MSRMSRMSRTSWMSRSGGALTLCVTLALALPAACEAQVRASEHGMVAQTIGATTITIEYYRPVARGRDSLFGRVVHWGDTWTPGANWATTLETDKDIRLDGKPLPKGKYSVWMIPRRDSAWTVMLSRSARRFHMQRPDQSDEQLRFAAMPEQGAHMETLAWYFPVVARTGALLRMHWGTTMVPINITVEEASGVDLTAEERAPYLGAYQVKRLQSGVEFQLDVWEADGKLRARRRFTPPGPDETLELIPAGTNRFQVATVDHGQANIEPAWTMEFQVEGGRARTVEIHLADSVVARGQRVK